MNIENLRAEIEACSDQLWALEERLRAAQRGMDAYTIEYTQKSMLDLIARQMELYETLKYLEVVS